jgi:hypothetical protein
MDGTAVTSLASRSRSYRVLPENALEVNLKNKIDGEVLKENPPYRRNNRRKNQRDGIDNLNQWVN